VSRPAGRRLRTVAPEAALGGHSGADRGACQEGRIKTFIAVLVPLVLAVLLVGCAPETSRTTGSGETDPDATLRFAFASGITRFDPHRATSSYDNTWLFPVYDRLIHMDPEGRAVPGLATDWSYGPAGAWLDLELREGVRFHDGEPFDAEAAAANLDRARTVRGSSVGSELDTIERMEILDPHHLRLHLSRPDAALPLILSDRAGMMISPAAFDDPMLDRRGVGAGPWRHVDYRTGNRSVYERFENYWDPDAAGVKRLELRLIPDETTRLNAVRSGQIDGATLASLQIEQARLAGLKVISQVGLEFLHIQVNRTRSEFGDRRVRQALNHAIRRRAIVDALGLGHGEPSAQPFPEAYPAFDPETGRHYYDYDPERARELLRQAGLEDGFEFELIVPNISSYLPLFEALQHQLDAVGIRARPRMLDGAQISERFYGAQESDAALVQWGGRPDPSQTIELLYTPGKLPNPGDHTTEEVQRLARAARGEIDPERRRVLLRRATAEITREALDVVLSLPPSTFGMRPQVEGFRSWMSGNKPEFRGVTLRTHQREAR
jgi:peptide/nickel transport system substrate-binding protein